MYPALRSLPSCAPVNRDHAREHERKPEFCFEVGNETRYPRRRGHVPIKCCGVACAQAAKKPNHKPRYVNSPADTFRFCHPTLAPVFCRRRHEHRFDRTCVNYCFLEQTCAFLDKLSDKQRCDLRVSEYTAFCNGPGDVKSPRVIVTPPSSRFCPWSAPRPPHYAVRRNGEPSVMGPVMSSLPE